MPGRLVILASGAGSTLQAFLDAVAAGDLDARIVAVGSDRPDCAALQTAEAAGVPTFAIPLERGSDRELWNARMADAIAALPYSQRAAIVLRFWHDCTEAEIAAALGCRPGTVGSLIHRALAELRKVMP